MTRRQFLIILAGAANEQSKQIARQLYAQPHRGERDRVGKLAPDKSTKIRGKGAGVLTKKPRG